ncbi:DUF3231 family protein [Wukongibacter baidiensis]|uniref:DUF3231 family protein n=1 Tax=Wukongibacter baidiensis TaxID=1723361 RepID=UPI003D7FD7EE
MKLTEMFTETPHKPHWGGASGLWAMCRHKIIGLPVLELLYDMADDPDLKRFIKAGIEMQAIPHIEKIQSAMQKENLATPPMPQRKKLDNQQIALALMEILRLSLIHDTMTFMDVTREDLRKFTWDITLEDRKAFDKIVQLNYKKNWLMNPPSA